MEYIGYILFFIMGATLGLMGAGGSILSIPILIYCFHIPIVTATSYALVIVGLTAWISASLRLWEIEWKKALLFGVPSASGVFLARHQLLPNLPNHFGLFTLNEFFMGLLIGLMFFASYAMVYGGPQLTQNTHQQKYVFMAANGMVIGLFMGLLGAGGGFLIIPALIFFLGFTMHQAVGSSLFIIGLNSVIGLLADKHIFTRADIQNLVLFLACAITGMVLGKYLNGMTNPSSLKKGFGLFIFILAIIMTIKEFF